ncbi:Cytosolic phospholipase A2 beta [Dinochytrium kinnereticum]|nr:Cytosolic phospholipase A2 beta [Dinochytrium kinnereticum]
MPGVVQVRIVAAKNLNKKDLITSNDAYCEVWIEDAAKKQSTGIVSSNSPTWNETFTLQYEPTQHILTFRVLDKDPKSSDSIGWAQYDFEPLKAKKRISDTKEISLRANLMGTDLTSNGLLNVEVVVLS